MKNSEYKYSNVPVQNRTVVLALKTNGLACAYRISERLKAKQEEYPQLRKY
jgi:predicted phosphoribosyltransferase